MRILDTGEKANVASKTEDMKTRVVTILSPLVFKSSRFALHIFM